MKLFDTSCFDPASGGYMLVNEAIAFCLIFGGTALKNSYIEDHMKQETFIGRTPSGNFIISYYGNGQWMVMETDQ